MDTWSDTIGGDWAWAEECALESRLSKPNFNEKPIEGKVE